MAKVVNVSFIHFLWLHSRLHHALPPSYFVALSCFNICTCLHRFMQGECFFVTPLYHISRHVVLSHTRGENVPSLHTMEYSRLSTRYGSYGALGSGEKACCLGSRSLESLLYRFLWPDDRQIACQ